MDVMGYQTWVYYDWVALSEVPLVPCVSVGSGLVPFP